MRMTLYYGNQLQEVELPRAWTVLPPHSVTNRGGARRTVAELMQQALEEPLGAGTIKEKVRPGDRVTIITDDSARHTPVRTMLPLLMDELRAAGVQDDAVDILVGLGTHAVMGQEALLAKFGPEIVGKFRISQHDCHSPELVSVGKLKTGAEVRINPLVTDADISIGIGTILPHVMNGFGGGPKIIFPAVSNYEAICEHHLAWTAQKDSIFGNIENNSFYREIWSVVSQAPPTYLLNSLFDLQDQVAAILFGHWSSVHEEGIKQSRNLCGIRFERKSDVTLISGYPYIESLQLMKPLMVGAVITKPGGTLILSAKANSSFPPFFVELFERIQKESRGALKKYAVETFRSGKLILEGAPVDLNCAMFFALVGRNDFRTVLVSKDIDKKDARKIGFVLYETMEEALKAESTRTPEAVVNVVPLGGTLPILPEGISFAL